MCQCVIGVGLCATNYTYSHRLISFGHCLLSGTFRRLALRPFSGRERERERESDYNVQIVYTFFVFHKLYNPHPYTNFLLCCFY